MNNIFISSTSIKKNSIFDIITDLSNSGIFNIELSGGSDYSENCLKLLQDFKKTGHFNFILHNYFPVPKNSFVLNLASTNNYIAKISYNHILNALNWSEILGAKFYSFHAGFLVDPDVIELGKNFSNNALYNRAEILEVFINRINEIAFIARNKGIELLIENNVLTATNFNTFKTNPFLMVDVDETDYIMQNTQSNVNLLIDIGHLKVSSNTLDFDPIHYINRLSEWTKAYHLSDNNGIIDSNYAVTLDSWFWPYIRKDLSYYTLEVYNLPINVFKQQLELVKYKIGI